MSSLANTQKSKLLFQMGLLGSLVIIVGIMSSKESLMWIFINPNAYHKTEGTILSSKIGGGGVWGAWRFDITYEYMVGDQKFISNSVHFGYQAMSDRSYAQGYIDKYFVGKRVGVYYDPGDPGKSVLEPQVRWYAPLYFYIMLLLIILTLFSLSIKLYREKS